MSPAPPPTSAQILARLLGGSKGATRLGGGVLALVALTLLVVGVSVWPLVRLRTDPIKVIAEPRSGADFMTEFDAAIDGDLAQIEGRSLFALPAPPSPADEVAEKPDPSKPTRYGGPSVIAMVNDRVWFSDGQRLASGESGSGSLKVLSIQAPWSARVEWLGAEFDVEFFQRSPLLMPGAASAASVQPVADRAPDRPTRRRNSAAGRTSRSTPPSPSSAPVAPPPPAPGPYPAPPAPNGEPGADPAPPEPGSPEPAPPFDPPAPAPTPPAGEPPAPPSPPPPAPAEPEASRP